MSQLHNITEKKIPYSKGNHGSYWPSGFPWQHEVHWTIAQLEFVFINITILSIMVPEIAALHILLVIIIPILKMCPSDSQRSS